MGFTKLAANRPTNIFTLDMLEVTLDVIVPLFDARQQVEVGIRVSCIFQEYSISFSTRPYSLPALPLLRRQHYRWVAPFHVATATSFN